MTMGEHELPRTLFVGIGSTGVAWYRCALPAMYLDCDWFGAVGEPPHMQFVTGLAGGGDDSGRMFEYDVVVLQQPASEAWLRTIEALRNAGITVLFDIDDYVHGVRHQPDHVNRDRFGLDRLDHYERCMAACDGVIVSTPWLAERYRRFNPRVWVCRNGLDLGRYNLTRPRRPGVAIGWAGASGHADAAKPWLAEVAKVMEQRPETRFVSVGERWASAFVNRFGPERSLAVGFAPLDTYPAAMTMFDVALAPAGKTHFYRGKSDLRWLEASALGIPVIADPTVYPDIEHGVTGFHAANTMDVRRILTELVDDAALRERVGEQARAHIREHRDMRVMAGQWAEVLREVAGERSRAASLARVA
jgi:glycosyltransferase involved in cell wall biosynthesis